ncbi:MAG: SusD/RagB family nutrient-binding outer membrane lipoprotein, partial [Cyanobacteria bacterium WB6_1B_304]|nr:SusD/RagB family nutrient-binding outer membrane lipoprotein [Cyanobacteria bacterium WB6_1B_304]
MRSFVHISAFCILVIFSACTKNIDSLNIDPNRPKSVTPGVMLGQMQYRVVSSTIRASRNFTHELMQVDAPRSSPNGLGLHRYVVDPGAVLWTPMYSYLTDV